MKEIFAQITKVVENPDGTCDVYGQAAAEVPDKVKEVMDYATARPEIEKWRDDALARSGGKSLGNIRSMHGKVASGKATAIDFDDVAKTVQLAAKIIDPVEVQKCREGVYTGFSVGGDYAKRWPDPVNRGLMRYTPKLTEISLVDNPCIPTALFQQVKLDGTCVMQKFVGNLGGFTARRLGRLSKEPESAEKYATDQARDPTARFAVSQDDLGNPHVGNMLRGQAQKVRKDGDHAGACTIEADAASHDAWTAKGAGEHEAASKAHQKAAEAHAEKNPAMALIHKAKANHHLAEAKAMRGDVPTEAEKLASFEELQKYNEDQPRDDHGRFGEGGGGTSSKPHPGGGSERQQAAGKLTDKADQASKDAHMTAAGERAAQDAHIAAYHAHQVIANTAKSPKAASYHQKMADEHFRRASIHSSRFPHFTGKGTETGDLQKGGEDQARDSDGRFASGGGTPSKPPSREMRQQKGEAASMRASRASFQAECDTKTAEKEGSRNAHLDAAASHDEAGDKHMDAARFGNKENRGMHTAKADVHYDKAEEHYAKAGKAEKLAKDASPLICKGCGGPVMDGKCTKCSMAVEAGDLKKEREEECPICGGEMDEDGCCEDCGYCPDDLLERAAPGKELNKAEAGVQFSIGFPKGGGGSKVQSVVFDKGKYTVSTATKWLKDHDFGGTESDVTDNTIRFRQEDPGQFDRIRMKTPGKAVVAGELRKAAKHLVIEDDGTKHLPYTGDDGKPDHNLMGAAHAALHGGYRGNKYEGPNKEKAKAKLKGIYAKEGMELPSEKSADADELKKRTGADLFTPLGTYEFELKRSSKLKQEVS